jgi:hypothetical protein
MAVDHPPPHELEERATAVVLVGRFNPRIFQPAWFDAKGLLAATDVEPTSLALTDGFVAFQTPLVSLVCTQERCQLMTTRHSPTPDVVRDLALGTFSFLLETPMWQCGINHAVHIPPIVRRWDDVTAQFGDPQKALRLLDHQRLNTVELRADRDDGHDGTRTVQLQPSVHLEGGVWFSLNDHVNVLSEAEAQNAVGADDTIAVLESIWDTSRALADAIQDRLAPRR